jgi:hypothetical protein
MKKNHLLPALVLFLFSFMSQSILARQAPQSLNDYHFVARGKMSVNRGVRPDQIVRMDNNGQILLACLNPQTPDKLKSLGIEFRRSQMELLVDWNLLEFSRKEKTYKTTIHIYGPEKSSAIRQKVQSATHRLIDSLKPDLLALSGHLQKINREENLFSILYSYILHDYSMRQFGEEIYRTPQLSEENPFWNGFAWAIYPMQKFDIGVTAMPAGGNQFFFVSSDAVPGPNFRQMMTFIKDVGTDLRVDNPELVKTFSAFGLCDDHGELTIPVMEGEWPAKMEGMAKQVYAHTVDLANSLGMKELLGMAAQARAAMFLHYELRYAVLHHLLETGFIRAPINFSNAAGNRPSDKRNLVFAIRQLK